MNFNNILDVLRRTGIFRFGATKAVYKTFKDRPEEFLYNDVFNAEKDIKHLNEQETKSWLKKHKRTIIWAGVIFVLFLIVSVVLMIGAEE